MTSFVKYEGAGNDFVLFEGRAPRQTASRVAAICHRRFGVGADGVIYLWQERGLWRWRFFNPDGREAEVCGNAARCVALHLASRTRKASLKFEWKGQLGTFVAEGRGREFRVRWPQPEASFRELSAEFVEEVTQAFNDRGLAALHWINVGNPHLVLVNHGTWNEQDRAASSPRLRSHPALGSAGANVTWVSKSRQRDAVRWNVVTFERGVEAETLACGSGGLAAYLAIAAEERLAARAEPKKLDLHFPGGRLRVERSPEGLWLGGPAREVFQGSLK